MADALNVVILGHGRMGSVHTDTALAIAKAGLPLDISVVDASDLASNGKKPFRDARTRLASTKGGAYRSLGDALDALDAQGKRLDVAVMAFSDKEHFPALLTLHERTPDFKYLFSEKPLTETVEQSEQLKDWLGKKFVSLNTVIHFSSVFNELDKLSRPGSWLEGATPVGFEAIWKKDRTRDERPTIGIRSDIVHPLGIVMEPLGQGMVTLLEGEARRGFLSSGAPDVVYSLPQTAWRTDKKLPVRLYADYAAPEQERSVTAWFRKGGSYLAAHMDFDVQLGNRKTDVLRIIDVPMIGGAPHVAHVYVGNDDHIDHGMAMGSARGKAQAWLGQSFRTALDPTASMPGQITTLGPSLRLQRAIGSVMEHPSVKVVEQPAVERLAALRQLPPSPSIEQQIDSRSLPGGWGKTNLESRIEWLQRNYTSLDRQLMRPTTASNAYLMS